MPPPTSPPSCPAWEAELLEDGVLPLADESTIRDPGYLHERIRHALEFSEQHRSDTGDDYAGLSMLRLMVEQIDGDLRNFTPAASEFLHMLEVSHPEMRWIRALGGGFIGARPYARREDADTPVIAEACARQLRLPEKRRSINGGRHWRGVIEGWTVTVYDH